MTATKQAQAAKRRLVLAMDECERTRAEAQWCNGYRSHGGDTIEMRDKEAVWWQLYGRAVKVRDNALRRYMRLQREAK